MDVPKVVFIPEIGVFPVCGALWGASSRVPNDVIFRENAMVMESRYILAHRNKPHLRAIDITTYLGAPNLALLGVIPHLHISWGGGIFPIHNSSSWWRWSFLSRV